MVERIVRGAQVMIDGTLRPASIHIERGVITAIAGFDEVPEGAPITEAGDAVVMPGVVDTHVHVNEPGRTEWEGFETATAAAAAGGVTTLVDMPLNSVPPTTTVAALAAKRDAARGRCHVDVGFWGGVVPGNAAELDPMLADGILGFKCFLIDSGVAEFAEVGEAELTPAMEILAAARAPLLVHAELA
ncbi:MAG TPA: amidohydrolase family protein, partial [Kofleriaceae bacterium]|nr:amidohydrolase family protein [Kofleriaceae bacterium]